MGVLSQAALAAAPCGQHNFCSPRGIGFGATSRSGGVWGETGGTVKRRTWWIGALVLTAALMSARGAVADTTPVGELSLSPHNGLTDFSGVSIPVFQGDASGNYVVSSPQTGTITSWSFLSGGLPPGVHFVLRLLAPVDATGTSWRAVATSAPVAVTTASGTDAINGPFPVNIAIEAGDRIALEPTDNSSSPIEQGVNGQDGIRYFSTPFDDGSSATLAPGSAADSGQVVPIQATVQFAPSAGPPSNSVPPQITGTAVDAQTLTCHPGVWSVAGPFAFAWSENTEVARVIKHRVTVSHVITTIGTGPTVTLPDLPPGITTIDCSVSVANVAGSPTVAAPPVRVQPLRPALGRKVIVRIDSHETPSPNPTITPGVGAGGQNVCTSGRWVHYPTKYSYYWYASQAADPKQSVDPHPKVPGYGLVGKRQSLTISTDLEGHRIFCGVHASNAAGTSVLAHSNRYVVKATAPVNTGTPPIVGTVTAPAISAKSAIENPDALTGNDIFLGCGTGRWNRGDLTFHYQWLFDRDHPGQSPPGPLTGLTYTGNGMENGVLFKLESAQRGFALLINGRPPGFNPIRTVDYLDDDVQCEVIATTHSGVSATAVSRSVHLRGPVVLIDNG
jgi:hypothetical protein